MAMWDNIIGAGNRYLKKMDLEDMAALKVCLLAAGTVAGLALAKTKAVKAVGVLAGLTAVGLAIPLMCDYLDELDPGEDPEVVQVQDYQEEDGT